MVAEVDLALLEMNGDGFDPVCVSLLSVSLRP